MPNWVKNILVLTGKDANALADKLLAKDTETGEYFVDFNKIDEMPESMECICGSCTAPAADYYLAAINPLMPEIAGKKITIPEFHKMLKQVNNTTDSFEKELTGTNQFGVDEEDFKQFKDRNGYLKYGKQIVENRINYKASTWYQWSNTHWGVKWNASESYVDRGTDKITIHFETPWAAVRGLIHKFITEQNKDLKVKVKYDYSEEGYGFYEGYDEYTNGEFINSKRYKEESAAAKKHWTKCWG